MYPAVATMCTGTLSRVCELAALACLLDAAAVTAAYKYYDDGKKMSPFVKVGGASACVTVR
jgi:hypothetical protein